jgi:hypothetical protein
MELTRNTFEQLSTLDKYRVEFRESPSESIEGYSTVKYVSVSPKGGRYSGVFYWFKISIYDDSTDFVEFEQRYSQNNGRCDKGWTCGYNFRKRMERDLQKANLI